mgnify:CR=1 FL=1
MTTTELTRSDKFNGTEPIHVRRIKEHETDSAGSSIDFERITDECDTFQGDSIGFD